MGMKQQYRITTSKGIDEKIYVPIHGQEQYLFLRGENIDNPIILHLHGGPAGPDAYMTYEYVKEIRKDYTVVCWDQRGCGRTYYKNREKDAKNQTATFEQAVEDVDGVVSYLCQRFGKEKIIILGHSYGSFLGTSYVHKYPEKVESYIGVGQVVSFWETQTQNYQEVLNDRKKKGKDTSQLTQVYEELMKDINPKNLMAFQARTMPYLFSQMPKEARTNGFVISIKSPDLSREDISWLVVTLQKEKFFARNRELNDITFHANVEDIGMEFQVPMYYISGEYDTVCRVNLVEDYYKKISAPKKKMVIMELCGHTPQNDNPKAFADTVRKLIRKEIEHDKSIDF